MAEVAHDSVNLTWDDPGDASITPYQVLRRDRDRDDLGVFTTITDKTGSATTSYTDTSVEPERRYVYRVVAVNAHGPSPRSGFVRAEPPAAPEPPADKESEGSPSSSQTTGSPRGAGDATGTVNILCTVQVGERLTLDGGTVWRDPDGLNNLDPAAFGYQWIRSDRGEPTPTSAARHPR